MYNITPHRTPTNAGVLAAAALWAHLAATAVSAAPERPNIIFMVADNLGRESVGYYGGHLFQTPRMNALAAEGVVFDNCLIATPTITPTSITGT